MYVLACDLGGTKTLFGIYSYSKLIKKVYQKSYKSKEWDDFNDVFKDFFKSLPKNINRPVHCCIAAAGRIDNDEIKVTNLPCVLNKNHLQESFAFNHLSLINDFSVLIFGIPFIKNNQYVQIQSPSNISKDTSKFISLIGAGTGLGVARGLINKDQILSFPSEGGHREFSPRTQDEWEFCKWLKEDLQINRVSIERVVSGRGLGDIARWKLKKLGLSNHPINLSKNHSTKFSNNDLAQIVSEFANNGDPIMTEVLELWISAYGSAAGDIALQELCKSGLWIAGGIAAKNLQSMKSIIFLNSLRRKGRFSEFVKSIPVNIIIDPEFGLFSAACKAYLTSEPSKKIF